MKEPVKQAFSDGEGQVSMMRIMSILSLLGAFGVVVYDLVAGCKGDNAQFYFTLLLVGAFAPKVLQKYLEGLVSKTNPKGTVSPPP